MKLVQLNAWGGRLGAQVKDLLIAENPDIVCLQEIIDVEGHPGLFTSLRELQDGASIKYSFHSPVMSFRYMDKTASFGNGIISKLSMKGQETIFTNLDYVENFSFDEHDYNIRNLQHAIIPINNKDVHILNHHGHHVREHKNGTTDTLRQCMQITSYINSLSGPIILTGDFNLVPDSESIKLINKRLRNLPKEHKLTTTRNHLTTKTEVCDYIFVSDDIIVDNFYMSPDVVSDHAALVLEFDI